MEPLEPAEPPYEPGTCSVCHYWCFRVQPDSLGNLHRECWPDAATLKRIDDRAARQADRQRWAAEQQRIREAKREADRLDAAKRRLIRKRNDEILRYGDAWSCCVCGEQIKHNEIVLREMPGEYVQLQDDGTILSAGVPRVQPFHRQCGADMTRAERGKVRAAYDEWWSAIHRAWYATNPPDPLVHGSQMPQFEREVRSYLLELNCAENAT